MTEEEAIEKWQEAAQRDRQLIGKNSDCQVAYEFHAEGHSFRAGRRTAPGGKFHFGDKSKPKYEVVEGWVASFDGNGRTYHKDEASALAAVSKAFNAVVKGLALNIVK